MCSCEAIKVPPKLSFWKKHDRRVHGFIAWMAVLNVALLAALPIAMYAQEPMNPPQMPRQGMGEGRMKPMRGAQEGKMMPCPESRSTKPVNDSAFTSRAPRVSTTTPTRTLSRSARVSASRRSRLSRTPAAGHVRR